MSVFGLRVLHGNSAGSSFPLSSGEVTIGRSPENGICIQDGNASRVHARILLIGGKAILQDNKSRNGVYVNNQRVAEHTLRPGDKIGIGSTILEFFQAQPARQPGGKPGRAPGGKPQGPQKKQGEGNLGRVALYGSMGVILLGLTGVWLSRRGPAADGATLPPRRATLAPLPAITATQTFGKEQMRARELIDHGDSKVVSGDLIGAYRLYAKAFKLDKQCDICRKKRDDARSAIVARVDEYERGGSIAFDNGRFNEAAERWQSAIELLGPFDKGRVTMLEERVAEAKKAASEIDL